MICVNDEQLLKVSSSIEVKEEGISNVICFNDSHAVKVPSLNDFTEEGIVICFNDEHLSKQITFESRRPISI